MRIPDWRNHASLIASRDPTAAAHRPLSCLSMGRFRRHREGGPVLPDWQGAGLGSRAREGVQRASTGRSQEHVVAPVAPRRVMILVLIDDRRPSP